jgi:ATP synthase protein I
MGEDQAGEDQERGAASVAARLAAARDRQGLDRPVASSRGTDLPPNALALGLRVGVELASALAVAVAIGYGLDHWLHTKPVFLAVFVLLGGAAGVVNVWRLVGPRAARGRF